VLTLLPDALPADGARLFKSGPIQVTADGATVWVANEDNDSVTRIRTADDAVLEVPLPAGARHRPRGLSVKEDGSEVWVACHDSDHLYVLGDGGDVLARVDLPWGSGPYSVALARDQATALVTLHRAAAVAVVDVEARTVDHLLEPIHYSPMGIVWTEDGDVAWVTHLFAPGEHPLMTRISTAGATPKVTTSMQIFATDPRHSGSLAQPYAIAEGGYLTTRGHPAQIPSAGGRREVWLPMQYNNISEDVYSPDSTVQSAIRRLRLDTKTIPNSNNDKVILTAVHVHDPAGGNAYQGPGWDASVAGPIDMAFSADGTMSYVLHEHSDDLIVVPVSTPAVKPAAASPLVEIAVGSRPLGMALSPVSELAYVYNFLTRDVSVVDLLALSELRRIPVTPLTGETLSPSVLRGAQLFHTSADPRISANGKIACGSCHLNGEIDGRTWAFHRLPGNHGPREVQTLLGLNRTFGPRDPVTGFGQLHRSGDRDEVQDFEHTFRGLNFGGTGFIPDPELQLELGPPNAGRSADLDAIAEYVLFLEPLMRSPERQADGSLSEAAVRGATFFVGGNRAQKRGDSGCAACHVPETGFVDFRFHNVGQAVSGSERELASRVPANHVNTATLVGVWATPLYNGVSGFAPTILSVLKDQAARAGTATRHGTPDGLSGRQLLDLAELVLSIDGDMTAAEVRSARDVEPPRIVRVEAGTLSAIDVWFNETVARGPVESTASWRLEEVGGGEVPIAAALWDGRKGDRVTLAAALRARTDYRLSPAGVILDAADAASGGVANALDLSDPGNTHEIRIGGTLTVTLGASSAQHLAAAVHDASTLGPGLSTWSHDAVWLFPVNGGPGVNTGFVRFAWRDRFAAATGVTQAAQITAASITLKGDFGDARPIELRRVLQPWSDPATGGDWNQNPAGGPTWRDHSHPSGRWNAAGAARLGGSGASLSDYGGANDLAAAVDAAVALEAINEEVTFSGPLVTDAYRFWFDNPSVDHGHAFRLAAGATQEARFHCWEDSLSDEGPFLTITYELPKVLPEEDPFRRGDADGSGDVNITDSLKVFNYLFLGGGEPSCLDAADADDDGEVIITDGIVVLNVLFLGDGEIALPGFEDCGLDPSAEEPPLAPCAYARCDA
jgi:DNA-binding beta-propeller fold protein YncE